MKGPPPSKPGCLVRLKKQKSVRLIGSSRQFMCFDRANIWLMVYRPDWMLLFLRVYDRVTGDSTSYGCRQSVPITQSWCPYIKAGFFLFTPFVKKSVVAQIMKEATRGNWFKTSSCLRFILANRYQYPPLPLFYLRKDGVALVAGQRLMLYRPERLTTNHAPPDVCPE